MMSNRIGFRVLACALALFPGVAKAQATVRPFDELQTLLKPQTLVVVTDDTGAETRGRVAEISVTSLTLSEVEWRQNGPLWEVHALGTTRQFDRSRVVEVARLSSAGEKSASLYLRSQGFGDLRFSLKRGTRVVLVDRTGHKTSGTVAEVSPTSLVLSTRGEGSSTGLGRLQPMSTRQNTFAESDVAEIRLPDGLGNGLAIGLGVGGWGESLRRVPTASHLRLVGLRSAPCGLGQESAL